MKGFKEWMRNAWLWIKKNLLFFFIVLSVISSPIVYNSIVFTGSGGVVTTNMSIWFPLNETSGTSALNLGNANNLGGDLHSTSVNEFVNDSDGVYRMWVKGAGSWPDGFTLNDSENGELTTPSGDNLSFCMVINMKGYLLSGTNNPYVYWLSDGPDDHLEYNNGSKTLKMILYDRTLDTSTTFSVGEIYHVCFTFDNSANTGRFYVNGSLDSTSTGFDQDYGSDPGGFYLGHRDYAKWVNATMGNVRYWNGYMLTSSEVQDVFDADLNVSSSPSDSCSYSTGDWTVNMNDNCHTTSNVDLPLNDVYCIGTGNWTIESTVSAKNFWCMNNTGSYVRLNSSSSYINVSG